MSHFIHAPGPAACRRPPSEPVVVVPGARVCPRVPRLPVTSVDGRPPDRTGNVALADVARIVPGAVAGNLASLTEGGNPADSGISSDAVRQAVAEAGTAYQKPEGGVPKTDLAAGVQASLDLADAAVQPVDILTGDGDSKKIKSSLLPSYVDDVIEVANYASLPSPGEEGKIYVTLDTNKTYRWGGTAYVEISNPDLTEYAKRAELFPAWAANTAYTTYSLVIHENVIYRCTEAHTSGAEWDSTKWAVASGAEVLAMIRDYAALSNKPSINGVTLLGNKTAANLGLATKADATLTEKWMPTFALTAAQKEAFSSEPGASDNDYALTIVPPTSGESYTLYVGSYGAAALTKDPSNSTNLILIGGDARLGLQPDDPVATFSGYQLGSQDDKPLASEAEAEALRDDIEPLLFAQYYPEGNVKSASEFTAGIRYDEPDTVSRTITVKPFCNTGDSDNDNSLLSERVVIPPFVDEDGNPYISDDGTRYKVVGVSIGSPNDENANLTAVIAPNTVTSVGNGAFNGCTSLASVSLPAVTDIESFAFSDCSALLSVSLPATESIGDYSFNGCTSLASVSLPAVTGIGNYAFYYCSSLASVDFAAASRSSVPTCGSGPLGGVPTTCKIIVPDSLYDAWIVAPYWSALYANGYKFIKHSEWEYARRYEVDKKADKPTTFTTGNLAKFDSNGNPTDSGIKASDKLDSTSAAPAFSSDSSVSYAVGAHVTYNGKLYKCTIATTGGTWDASKWTADTMTDPDAVLDVTSQNQLRVVAKDGTILWAQGYDLASTSSATLACDATNNFTFADGATTQAFTLPTAPTGKVGDFGLDIDNSANTGAATMTLTGLDTTFSVVVPKGESLTDMLSIAAGELARFYVTLTTFRVNSLPTWHIVKQVVENGGATV